MADREMTKEGVAAFLAELNALTKKYEVVIRGCGYCGSPNIYPLDDLYAKSADYLRYTEDEGYSVLFNGNKVIGIDKEE